MPPVGHGEPAAVVQQKIRVTSTCLEYRKVAARQRIGLGSRNQVMSGCEAVVGRAKLCVRHDTSAARRLSTLWNTKREPLGVSVRKAPLKQEVSRNT